VPEPELLRSARDGNEAAREELVEAFAPLIAGMARRYRNARGVDRGELMQEGVVGLLRALERYDPEVGPFWPYASWWVRQAMQRLVAELTRPVVLSDRALRQLARVRNAHSEHLRSVRTEPSTIELAKRAGLTRTQVEALAAVERPARRLEEPIGRGDPSGGTLGELLADPVAEDDYGRVEELGDIEEMRRLASGLSDREREILAARFGLNGPEQTLRQIAGQLELSAERVRQIELHALAKLRSAAASRVSARRPSSSPHRRPPDSRRSCECRSR
jgi:RNA polymerase sigma factor (sigma-70 family)